MPVISRVLVCLAGLVSASTQASPSASSVCVYNNGAFALHWHLQSVGDGKKSAETSTYPVWQVKCLDAGSVGVSDGAALVPVVKAVLGKEVTVSEPVLYDVLYDSKRSSQITYICEGTTLSFSCKAGAPPLPAANVTRDVGNFLFGFADGLAIGMGFSACMTDLDTTYQKIVDVVAFFKSGINHVTPEAIAKAFRLIGELLKDVAKAFVACKKTVKQHADKITSLAVALSGDVADIVKVVGTEALHIFHGRKEITGECKAVSADWDAGDYEGSGKALGDVISVLLGGIVVDTELVVV